MTALVHFLQMGGYARFLWPAYGITLAILLLNVYWARRLVANARSEAKRRLAIREELVEQS